MLTVLLVRHGQTDCSVRGTYCGRGCNVSLNRNGARMAEAITNHLASRRPSALYCSPQHRAIETLTPLSRCLGLDIQVDADLCELDYGEWDGRTPKELRVSAPRTYEAWLADPASNAPPAGETALAVGQRACRALAHINTQYQDGTVVLVSHKTTLRVLICQILGIDVARYRDRIAAPLAAISTLTFRPSGPRLDGLADVCHLPQELRYALGS